jgi:GNAT superfamily N-acetyltransferase
MSTKLSFLIRDGLEKDIEACLNLDHSYQTDHVWQMGIIQETGNWQVAFKTEHLPRTLEVKYTTNERQLRLALSAEQCFLVAYSHEQSEILGYLAMQCDPVHQSALLYSLVVSQPFRRCGIGKRLLNVSRQWAREHNLARLTVEVQTQNYPGIAFCQSAGLVFCGYNDRQLANQDIALFFSQPIR